ncbi:hypothetical protein Daura_23060 [Dactylosporangium aurantiacum]|uniref:Uncharacterized protein n=1 Tax=Dactylosporangium aurantiacum TaxID=35754 RepID=A0A9Q9IS46_9ACTN|nr:hypothetical protein [Dactylosporangium aurantiacum]UWZ58792.1 hypothetical protein Daura_23060 [Dactylosporangium aurantiacum]
MSLTWISLASAVGFGSIAAAIAVPVCRTIRHNKRANLFERTFDKLITTLDVPVAEALTTLQATIRVLEQGPPESEVPSNLRAVGALARKAPPTRRRKPQQSIPESDSVQPPGF